jgi:hypothetical protein
MKRRAFIAAVCAPLAARAGADEDAWRAVAVMAAGLAEDNAPAFLKPIDASLPGREALAAAIRALLEQATVQSIIEPIGNEGSGEERTLVLDWQLRLTRKADSGDGLRTVTREQAVTLGFRKQGKRWVVIRLEPREFFAPPDFR